MFKSSKKILGVGIGVLGTYSLMKFNSDNIIDKIVVPFLNKIDPETAHNLTLKIMSYNLTPKYKNYNSKFLENRLLDINFKNPVGLAAGYEKNAQAYKSLTKLGFGFLELGSVTLNPQEGNDLPRIFRYNDNKIIINNCGLNSNGLEDFFNNISVKEDEILGVNLGINDKSKYILSDYRKLINKTNSYADYFVINLSCPNTENDGLQTKKSFEEMIISKKDDNKPILYKLAPNLTDKQIYDISKLALKYNIDGLIISNTKKCFLGGISGKPLTDISTDILKKFYKYTNGKILLIGVGGIMNSEDAYNRILSGASLIEIYSGFIFDGPKIIYNINKDIELFLIRDGFNTISEAIGSKVNTNEDMIEKISNKTYDLYSYAYEYIENYINS